jgi:hypothetical protein
VVTTYLFGLAYYAATGTYFFFDSYIPIAVFLGMHLLFTDPSTAPRTELGRMIFGALYAFSTILLYQLLGAAGLPTFYDKLLQVPLLNLLVRRIDRTVRDGPLRRWDPAAIGRALDPTRRRLAYVALWTLLFAAMSAAQGVGDRHRGQWIPFWRQACGEHRPGACEYLSQLYATTCRAGSGWSCNELGNRQADTQLDRPTTGAPPAEELPILLRGSKGPIREREPAELQARACAQGWTEFCDPNMGKTRGSR